MSADIIAFPIRSPADVLNSLAAKLGTPDEWTASAIAHLKAETSGGRDGFATVSRAALHVALGYIEQLEERLGIIPPPCGAA